MSWYHLAITTIINYTLSGGIGGYVDPLTFKLGDGVYLISIVYTLSPSDVSGSYEVSVEVYQQGRRILLESDKKKIPQTTVYIVDGKEIIARPGRYRILFRVSSSGKESHIGFPLTIEENEHLNLSSLVFVSRFYEDTTKAPFKRGDIAFLPNPSATFKDTLRYFFEIYDVIPDTSKLVINWSINRGDKLIAHGKPQVIPVKLKDFSYRGSIPLEQLEDGEYTLRFQVVDIALNEKRVLKRNFRIKRGLALNMDDDIRYFIDYIASAEELAEFKKIKDEKARRLWIEKFWQKKDPTGTFYPLFRQRVLEADAKFSTPFKKGRYTDRGRVYILFGMPDEIRREEIGVSQKSYQIWVYYRNNYKFVFYDQFNTGDYRLTASNVPGFGVYREDIDQYFDFNLGE